MSKFPWLYASILGDDPTPAPPIPKLPIVDDPSPLCPRAHDPRTDALIRRIEIEAAIKAIFDPEMVAAVKAASVEPSTNTYLDDRSLQDNSQVMQPNSPHLPKPVRHPRKPLCDCMCEFCERQDCRNCCAEDRCPQSGEGLLSEIMDIGEAVREVFRQATRDRARQSKLDQHKKALRPMVRALRNEFPYRSVKIDEAADRVVDATADYVADVTATV